MIKTLTILTLAALFACSSYAETDYIALPKIEKIRNGQIALKNPKVSGTLKVDTIEEFTGSAGVTVGGVSNLNGSIGATNDVVPADDIIAGDDVTAVDDIIAGDDLVGDEANIDGKFAVVGTDATTGLMVARGTFTNGQASVVFGANFLSAPAVVVSWTDDISSLNASTNASVAATSITVSNFVPRAVIGVTIVTNGNYIAVGARP